MLYVYSLSPGEFKQNIYYSIILRFYAEIDHNRLKIWQVKKIALSIAAIGVVYLLIARRGVILL